MKKAVIFGCGKLGIHALPTIIKEYDVVAYSDNDQQLWGKDLDGTEGRSVIAPDKIFSLIGSQGVAIICVEKYFPAIAKQLEAMNLSCAVFMRGKVFGYNSETGIDRAVFYRGIEALPRTIFLALSNNCNLRCRYCFVHGENPQSLSQHGVLMSWDVVCALIRQIKKIPSITAISSAGSGETFMHPEWFEMLSHILENTQVSSLQIITNGTTLTKEVVGKLKQLSCKKLAIRISIDGLSPEENDYWRSHSSYERIKENVLYAQNNLDKESTTLYISNVCVLPAEFKNDTSLEKINGYLNHAGDWLRDEFPDIAVSTSGVVPPDSGNPDGTDDITIEIDGDSMINPCYLRFLAISVSAEGDIRNCPCAVDAFYIGNVLTDDMFDVWLNEPGQTSVRQAFRDGKCPCNYCAFNANVRKFLVRKCLN